jgi:sterol desaturase/sphingolipid hydroxylase (fatty acid hydroxylase superfamily)
METISFLGFSQQSILLISVPVIFALIAFEALLGAARHQQYYTKGDTWGTIGMLAGNITTQVLVKSASFIGYTFVYEYRIFNFSETLPPWLLLIVALLCLDLTFYVWHRASHRVRVLWAIHLSHHSSEEMNYLVSFRQPWLAPIFKMPFFAILPFVGLDPSVLMIAGLASTFWGVIGHTQIVPKLGVLEWFFNTPSAHRVHHGTNPEYVDKNYANMFIFYDRIFGTYAKEVAPVNFGLTNQIGTNNPIKITFSPWQKIWRDIKSAQSFTEILGYLFCPPDWKPNHSLKTGVKTPAQQQ